MCSASSLLRQQQLYFMYCVQPRQQQQQQRLDRSLRGRGGARSFSLLARVIISTPAAKNSRGCYYIFGFSVERL